jgi:hypothetical protein
MASISLQSSPSAPMVSCGNATVANSNLTISQYAEAVTCLMGPDMPAAAHALWVCLPNIGCGYQAAAVQANASVASISAAAGSTAGGTQIVITGTGEQCWSRCMTVTFI